MNGNTDRTRTSGEGVPNPPDDLPADVVTVLQELDGHGLRETIIYARELLDARQESPPDVEPLPGEEVVRVTEQGGFVEVVKRQPCGRDCPDCPHGPYLYHVTTERLPDGTVQRHWSFIGRVVDYG